VTGSAAYAAADAGWSDAGGYLRRERVGAPDRTGDSLSRAERQVWCVVPALRQTLPLPVLDNLDVLGVNDAMNNNTGRNTTAGGVATAMGPANWGCNPETAAACAARMRAPSWPTSPSASSARGNVECYADHES
jgi:hypothetical protein